MFKVESQCVVNKVVDYLANKRGPNFAIILLLILIISGMLKPIPINEDFKSYFIENNPYTTAYYKIRQFEPYKDNIQIQITPQKGSIEQFLKGLGQLEQSLKASFPDSKIESLYRAKAYIQYKYNATDQTLSVLTGLNQIPLMLQLISVDCRHTLTILYLNGKDFNPDKLNSIIIRSYPGIERIKAISELQVENQIEKSIGKDLMVNSFYILVFYLLAMILFFRNPTTLLVVFSNALFSIIPLLFFFGLFNVKLNMVTVIAIPLVFISSFTDTIYLLVGYYNAPIGMNKTERIRYSIRKYVVPSFFTSFITAIAFLSFLFSNFDYIRNFGLISGLSIMLEFFVTFLTVPFFLGFFKANRMPNHSLHFVLSKLLKFNKSLGTIMIAVMIVSLFFVNKLYFHTDFESFIPLKTELRPTYRELTTNFHSLFGMDVLIEKKDSNTPTGIKQITLDWVKKAQKVPGVRNIYSFKDEIDFYRKELGGNPFLTRPKSDNVYIKDNLSRIRIVIKDPNQIEVIKNQLDRISQNSQNEFRFYYYSPALIYDYINTMHSKSLLRSLLFSAVIIFLTFIVLTRSIRNASVCMLANAIPLGALVIMFIVFGIDVNMGTAMTAIVCLGLIVDYAIQLVYCRLIQKDNLEALSFSLLITCFALVGSFICFIVSDFKPNRVFGILSAAVFLIAFLSDYIIINWLLKIPGEPPSNKK
ncbi:MAG: hypothetical protein Q8909_07810 [Bacteroidota bacterium]|nr:hypothetical protein [Bacteroidota bacterium]